MAKKLRRAIKLLAEIYGMVGGSAYAQLPKMRTDSKKAAPVERGLSGISHASPFAPRESRVEVVMMIRRAGCWSIIRLARFAPKRDSGLWQPSSPNHCEQDENIASVRRWNSIAFRAGCKMSSPPS